MATNNEERSVLNAVRDSLEATDSRLSAAHHTHGVLVGRKDDLLLLIPENDDTADASIVNDVSELQGKAEYLSSLIQSE